MKRLRWAIVLLLPTMVGAQGIQFENNLSWVQVQQKAKQENKYIFVDCAASWCKPCRQMQKDVFALKEVGDYMNDSFISVEVQMDTSKNDGDEIKSWYADAHDINKQYVITTYPSYLFFSPNGKLVHRYMYSMGSKEFLKTAAQALDPNKQYCVLLENYLSGKKDFSKFIYLSVMTKNMKNDSLANEIARDYLHNYLDKQDERQVFQKKNFEFIDLFLPILSSKDAFFKLIYRNTYRVDSIYRPGAGKFYVERVITKEEITSRISTNNKPIAGTPNWQQLKATIQKKYDKWYAEKTVLDAQYRWSIHNADTAQIIKYKVKQIDKYGLDTVGLGWVFINNFAWDLFTWCNNKDTLNKAAGWMAQIIKNHPDDATSCDTYANLLYRAGRKEEARQWEGNAIEKDKEQARKTNTQPNSNYSNSLDKMKRDLPTW